MLQYPDVLDLSCVTTLIDIVKNRQINERKQELAICAWNVQGYLQKIFIGVAPKASYGLVYAHSGELQEGLEELEVVLSNYEVAPQVFGAEDEKEVKDIGTIIMVVSLVLQLLRTLGFIKNKNTDAEYDDDDDMYEADVENQN
jgi:hypothetical protein